MFHEFERSLEQKRILRIESHIGREVTPKEKEFTIVKMPLGTVEYRAFFISCFLTSNMVNRQGFAPKNLSWQKYIVKGGENELMIWLIEEITGRFIDVMNGDERWKFLSNDDNYIDFHNAMDCFRVELGKEKFPKLTKYKYLRLREECIKKGIIFPVTQKDTNVFVNPNLFIESISKKKKKYLIECYQNNMSFMPIQSELMGYLMGKSNISGCSLSKDLWHLNKFALKRVREYYIKNFLCCQSLFREKYVDLESKPKDISVLSVV